MDAQVWINGEGVEAPMLAPDVIADTGAVSTDVTTRVIPPADYPTVGAGFLTALSAPITMTNVDALSSASPEPAAPDVDEGRAGDAPSGDRMTSLRLQQVALGLRAVVSMAFPAGSPRIPTPQPDAASPGTDGGTIAATPTPTATVAPPCVGGDLQVNAWPMDSVHKGDHWEAQVFAEGIGGSCTYTYAWNDEADIRGDHMSGPIVFSVSSTEFAGVIVGTVVVTSGDETVRQGVYITPP
jgi:hypothetical protein